MPQQPDNIHADEAYNRALIRLYRSAIEAGLRAEQAEQEAEDAAPTTKPAATSSSEGFDKLGANQSPHTQYTA